MKKTLLVIIAAAASHLAFAQDVGAGQKAFQACAACHSTAAGVNGVGPSLAGIVGRKAGSLAGFNYSRAMKNSGITWDEASLDAYIANPQQEVPGNHMPYAGMTDAQQRAALVAFLKSQH
jgi:cytochrome c2